MRSSLIKAIVAASSLASSYLVFDSKARADEWGCQVILCISNPAGATQYAECRPPINKLWRWLAKGRSFPTCSGVRFKARGLATIRITAMRAIRSPARSARGHVSPHACRPLSGPLTSVSVHPGAMTTAAITVPCCRRDGKGRAAGCSAWPRLRPGQTSESSRTLSM